MAITYNSTTATQYSGTGGALNSVAPTYPTGIVAGDLLLLTVGQKPDAINSGTITPPNVGTDWILVDSLFNAGGYAAQAGDSGNTSLAIYYRIATGTEVAGATVTVTLGANNISWANITRYSNTLGGWQLAAADGQRTTTPTTALSITTTGTLAVTANDHLFSAFVIPTDVTTPNQFTNHAFAISGATIAAATEITEPDNQTNNDIGGAMARSNVTAGTATATVTYTATLTGTLTNVRGPLVVVRIREVAPPAQTLTASSVVNTTAFGAPEEFPSYLRFVASSTPVAGTGTSLTIPFPTGTQQGDWVFVVAGFKGDTATPPLSAAFGVQEISDTSAVYSFYNWAFDPDYIGGYASNGIDTGNVQLTGFMVYMSSTPTGGNQIQVTAADQSVWVLTAFTVRPVVTRNALRQSVSIGSQSVTPVGTRLSVTTQGYGPFSQYTPTNPSSFIVEQSFGLSNAGISQPGDLVVAAFVIPTDNASFSNYAFVIADQSLSVPVEIAEPISSLGQDIGGFVSYGFIKSGLDPVRQAPIIEADIGGTTTNARGSLWTIILRPENILGVTGFGSPANTSQFGSPSANYRVRPTGVDDTVDSFGTPTVSVAQPATNLSATSVVNTSTAGSPALRLVLRAAGAANTSVAGSPQLRQNLTAQATVNTSVVGSPTALQDTLVTASSVVNTSTFGLPTVEQTLAAQGVVNTTSVGSPALTLVVTTTAVVNTTAFGSAQLHQIVRATATVNTNAFGAPTLAAGAATLSASAFSNTSAQGAPTVIVGAVTLTAASTVNASLYGSPALALYLTSSAVVNASAFGSPTVSAGAVTVTASGVLNTSAFGHPIVESGVTIVEADSVINTTVVGSPAITLGAATIAASGVPSSTVLGTPTVSAGAVTLSLSSVLNTSAFGAPAAVAGAVTLTAESTINTSAFGAPSVARGAVTVLASSVVSSSAFGSPSVLRGAVTLQASSVDDSATITGSPTVTRGAVTLSATGVLNTSAFGSSDVSVGGAAVRPASVVNSSFVGAPSLTVGPVTVTATGVPSVSAFGTPTVVRGAVLVAASTVNDATDAFGVPTISTGAVGLAATGVSNLSVVGAPAVVVGAASLSGTGVSNISAFGSPRLGRTTTAAGVVNTSQFGSKYAAAELINTIASSGATYSTATTVQVPYPPDVQPGQLILMILAGKMTDATAQPGNTYGASILNNPDPYTENGWDEVNSEFFFGGYSSVTASTGNIGCIIWHKVTDGTEAAYETLNISGFAVHASTMINFQGRPGNGYVLWSTMDQKAVDGGPVVLTFDPDTGYKARRHVVTTGVMGDDTGEIYGYPFPPIRAGDLVVAGFVTPTAPTTGASFTTFAVDHPGMVIGGETQLAELDSDAGLSLGGFLIDAHVVSGTSLDGVHLTAGTLDPGAALRGLGFLVTVRTEPVLAPVYVQNTSVFGAPQALPGPVTLQAASALNTSTFGQPVVTQGNLSVVVATSVANTNQPGTPAVLPQPVTCQPTGVQNLSVVGTPRVGYRVQAAGLPSSSAIGTPTVQVAPKVLQATGVASQNQFGGAIAVPGAVTVQGGGVAPVTGIGTPIVQPGPVTARPGSVVLVQAFGASSIFPGPVVLAATAVDLPDLFGAPYLVRFGPVSPTRTVATPAELREVRVAAENRTVVAVAETGPPRVVTIAAETRVVSVAAESRLVVIPAEQRVVVLT